MRSLKMLGFAILGTVALLTFTGSAYATTVTSPTGTPYAGEIKGETTGHGVLDNPAGKIECRVGVEGKIESQGVGVTAKGSGKGNLLEACTGGWHKTTVSSGTIEAHWTSGYNGVITSSGATVESTNLSLGGITCRYATNNTQIGVVTGGSPAVLHIAASIPFHSGSIFCGTGATLLTGSGVVTTPSSLYLDS